MTAGANGSAINTQVRLGKAGWCWTGFFALLFLGQWLLGRLDDFTLLTPDPSGAQAAWLILLGLAGLAVGVGAYAQSGGSVAVRSTLALRTGVISALVAGLVTFNLPNFILGKRYFAPDKTTTFDALLPIGRAYRTSSRTGVHWTIQPTPLWTNIDITKSDYDFIVVHKRVDDVPDEPDNVSSHGAFCARVTMQKSGEALRILHTGTALPPNSVIGCPHTAIGQPYLELH